MSGGARAWGVARSIAMYHFIPFRQRRLRRLYATFVQSGDLVFDVGAHAGNRTRAFAKLGCRVIAIEPQPDFARLLRSLFARSTRVTVVEAAVTRASGQQLFSISDGHPTVSTIADEWKGARSQEIGFARVRWNRTIAVETVSLDALIDRFGSPAFIKIDVEGAEPEVLTGLTRAVPALSFEFLTSALPAVEPSTARLLALGAYRFNWSSGESYRLAEKNWLTAGELTEALRSQSSSRRWPCGDIYARLTSAFR